MGTMTFHDVWKLANGCRDHPVDDVVPEEAAKAARTALSAWRQYGDWRYDEKDDTDSESFAVGQLPDGHFAVVQESEDYTGHG